MRYLIVLISISNLLSASMFDFYYLDRAKKAYDDGNYTVARNFYNKVDNDEARFKVAQTFYYEKKYSKAIDIYQDIDELNLQAKKLYNMGNIYAKLKKFDDAIYSYEESLKIKEDEDCRFNLKLLKKKKKEEEKKKKKQDKKNNKSKKDSKNKEDSDKKKSEEEKKEEDNNSKEKDSKKENKDKKREEEKKQSQMSEQNITQPPISNMEERKWQKMLNKRGVNTLMIPLNKGKRENEENPW